VSNLVEYQKFIEMAVNLRAKDAKILKTDSIVTAAWICWKCRYGCDGYNSSLCCPPNTPTYRETRELVDCYEYALLVHFTEDSNNMTEDPIDYTKVITTLEREIFLAGYYKAFALSAGRCRLCAECTMKYCGHAKRARPSMESCGIDVFSTVRNNGYRIEVLKDKSYKVNRFCLVLIE
jgi:predicted metal-binding protein